ncbi:hypothetical protein [Salmonella enterica]|uniref:hypothetical protein n=3 Tax=Salmonella enterica TaxID=28901 RepID=UPI000D574872|nr:hypothetical protein C4783_27725 [Salmonella enterica subsp. enterica serovar Gaminara]
MARPKTHSERMIILERIGVLVMTMRCTKYAPLASRLRGSEMATNEILPVTRIGRADGDYGCYCPHCGNPMFFSESELDDIRGSQYQHTRIISLLTGERCEGWLEVSTNASFSRILFDQGEG